MLKNIHMHFTVEEINMQMILYYDVLHLLYIEYKKH